uniref:substrate-binding domain-containing protein n=1 Tax=Clavibacter michiganensis TaxID=28447 RepID=UPI0029301F05
HGSVAGGRDPGRPRQVNGGGKGILILIGTPAALVCANDAVAAGAYQALHRAGLRVPEDVSVVAFDGSAISRALDPPLASVALPQLELGRLAVELLFDRAAEPAVHRVPMALVPGGSIGPVR